MITIATDCSGIDAPVQALQQLNINYKQEWYCDIDKFARKTAEANYPKPDTIYTDIISRDNSKLPHIDLYVCGFPCQAFSLAGKRLGTKDHRSGVIPIMLETIHYSKPKIIILENVKNFRFIEKGKPYRDLIDYLQNENYNVYADIYNTKDYSIPQNRQRIYIVCIRKDISIKEYIKPKSKEMKPFEDFLIDKEIRQGDIPSIYHKNLHKIKENAVVIHPHSFSCSMNNIINTLDTNCNRTYILKQNRRILAQEALLLQGFPKDFKQVVSNSQFFKQIGNTMSVNVLKEIILEALRCIEKREKFKKK